MNGRTVPQWHVLVSRPPKWDGDAPHFWHTVSFTDILVPQPMQNLGFSLKVILAVPPSSPVASAEMDSVPNSVEDNRTACLLYTSDAADE